MFTYKTLNKIQLFEWYKYIVKKFNETKRFYTVRKL